ncbi:MAG: phosphoribosylamine--glycine ligase [Dehalococcoidia bacterium]
MNVLIVGSGAREHALAWKLRQSPKVDDLFVAPGNPGTGALATNLALNPLDFPAVAQSVTDHRVELVVVGPEEPLAAGLVDYLSVQGIAAFGPTRAAAQIESSKQFAKEVMLQAGIPTARARAFTNYEAAAAYLKSLPDLPVIKADGLAAGKGVTLPATHSEALATLRADLVERTLADAGRTVLIEERLVGLELSAHAFSDGVTVRPMVCARDHKAAWDGGRGPNTGGMGAYSSPGIPDFSVEAEILDRIVKPTIEAMARRGHPYRGTLYPGLMLTKAGVQVIEFNCRFGDPETQVILPRLQSDLFDALWGVVSNQLERVELRWSNQACIAVVLASEGYPGAYRRGEPISGLNELDEGILVFHSGTAIDKSGRLVTSGGRVLTVVGTGQDLAGARRKVYENVGRIRFQGRHYRLDIGAADQ